MKKLIFTITVCFIGAFWAVVYGLHYFKEPIIERQITERIVPMNIDSQKIKGDCALIEPPCWEDFSRTRLKLRNP